MFKHLLDQAGLTKTELARSLGMKAGTVSSWGDNPPAYAVAYLKAVTKLKRYENLHNAIKDLL